MTESALVQKIDEIADDWGSQVSALTEQVADCDHWRREAERGASILRQIRDGLHLPEPMSAAHVIEQTAALREALELSTGELEYWLKTYRSHSGFMNSTHLSERDGLRKRVNANRALLAATEAES